MFEYLMPLMFMRAYPGDAAEPELPRGGPMPDRLRQRIGACPGESRSPPSTWSTCTGTTSTRPSAFPGLGMKRGLRDELVVAPYAIALAMMVDAPCARCQSRSTRPAGAGGPLRLLRIRGFLAAQELPERGRGRRRAAAGQDPGAS